MVLKDFGVTAICCTPSYFLHLMERAGELGVDIKKLPLRAGVFGAEPWTQEMRLRIEAGSSLKAYDIYGLSEIIGPGVAMECAHQNGLHIFEDHFYPEIIDPQTCEVLPDGAEGELVLTTLSKKAMPMIRYRTRDITSLAAEPCPCGRTIRRIRRIGRRSDDMFIIRGVNVFPTQIEEALLRVEGTAPHYLIEVDRPGALDEVTVKVEMRAQDFSDKMTEMQTLRDRIDREIQSITGIRVNVELVTPQTLERSAGKARRVIDRRRDKGLF